MNLKRLFPAILAVAGSLIIAACGSSSSSGSTHTTASASASGSRAKLVACLKQHGVTLPSHRPGAGGHGFFGGGGPPAGGPGQGAGTGTTGGFGAGGRPPGTFRNSKFARAFKACGGSFGHFRAGGAGRYRPHFSSHTLNAFVTCVRKHGYDLPKPNTAGNGPIFPRSIESNKKFQAAARSCSSLLRPNPAGTTSTTTSS